MSSGLRFSCAVLLAAAALLAATPVSAQSGVRLRVRSGTPQGDRFRVDSAGGVVALSQLFQGVHPASGPGYRMMWIPFYAAFRAGSTDDGGTGTFWDDGNVGYFSWAGGNRTRARGIASFAMGEDLLANASYSATFGRENTVTGQYGFAAGRSNRCTDLYCTALGFTANAAGEAANALGFRVTANADYSTAIGSRATTMGFAGSFVYGDASTSDSIRAVVSNEFAVRADGGFRFRTSGNLGTGCNLAGASGGFICSSSRALKETFAEVDGEALLARIRTVPLNSWTWIEAPASGLHVGPFAEDFHAAFALGADSTAIGHQDIDGVNFGGVKALEARTRELQRENGELAQQLAALRAELLEVSRRLEEMAPARR